MKILDILSIINFAFALHIFFKLYGFRFELHKEETWLKKTLLYYEIRLIKKTSKNYSIILFRFKVPIRNEAKTRMKEEIESIISEEPESNKRQRLGAKFSWLKTQEQVTEFEKNYSVVDRIFVEKLVREWKQKNNFTEV